jgi:hypothetical protein
MRLTLRTLLAYLDDILEPAQAKEIGAKIAESGYASSLVGRINDVVRRRRISAPQVSGPGSAPDPNIVAEYLDNTLAPEAVADLERICLESDAHLAEVAACHQVLTLVKSEPVEIAGGMRERMYALGIAPAAAETNGEQEQSPHVPRVAAVAAADLPRNTHPGAGEVSLEDRLPEALRAQRRSWTKVLPYLIGVVIIGVWGYLMLNDEALTGMFASRPEPAAAPDVEVELEPPVVVDEGPVAPAAEDAAQPTNADVGAIAAIPREAVAAPDLTMTPPPTVDEGQPIAAADEVPKVTLTPDTDAQAPADDIPVAAVIPAPEVTPHPDAFDPPPDVPAKPPLPEPYAVQDASSSGVLLHFRTMEQGWYPLRPRSLIHPQEDVAAPRPFDATFTVGESGRVAEIILRGGTRVTSLGSTDDGRFGFDIVQGQMIVRRKESAPADEPVSMRIVAREQTYAIQLLEPGTIVGIEVIPLLPTGAGDDRGARWCDGGIAVTAGAATVTVGDQEPVNLNPAIGWLKFVTGPDAPPPQPQPLVSLANWLNLEAPSASAIVRRYAALYENEFTQDQPIARSIRPVVKDRRPPLSELATQTLALTGGYPGLVDALSAPHEESRLSAILGLQSWLPLEPENAERLQAELQDRFRAEDAQALYRLLWGYTEEDARNPVVSEDLVNWMGHSEIAVRELAFYHVLRLTGRRYDFRPNDPAPQRAVAIDRWRTYLRDKGALIGQ